MASNVVLYGHDISPPVRACALTLKALDIKYKYKVVDIFANEQKEVNFVMRNPQHTVPLLDDNGTWIWDSHAIIAYLVDKYSPNDQLYPKDLAKRALVNQRMFFEASILFMSLRNISRPLFKRYITVVEREKTINIQEGYDLVERFLGDNLYITGDTLTIADFSCVTTVCGMRSIVEINPEKYPKTLAWLERLSQLPYYEEANGKGNKEYTNMLKSKLTEINL